MSSVPSKVVKVLSWLKTANNHENTFSTFHVERIQEKKLSKLNDEEFKGYEFIRLKEKDTRKEYQEHFGFKSDKKAERHLRKMVDLNQIIREGSGPSTYYEIIPT